MINQLWKRTDSRIIFFHKAANQNTACLVQQIIPHNWQ